jgi:hypothetical protein
MNKYLKIFLKKQILIGLSLAGLSTLIAFWKGEAYWLKHPYFAGLLTGITTLFITFLIIENLKIEYANSLWREVAKVAYKDISRFCKELVALVQLTYVPTELISDESNFNSERKRNALNLDPWDLDLSTRAQEGKRQEFSAVGVIEDLRHNTHRHLPLVSVMNNFSNVEFSKWALLQIDTLWTSHCDLMAKWASLMMNSGESREILNSFASFDHDFRILYYQLKETSTAVGDKQELFERIDLSEVWFNLNFLDIRARVLHNELRRKAEPDDIGRPDAFVICDKMKPLARPITTRKLTKEKFFGACDFFSQN